MIIIASQRGGAGQLAAHLMNDRDNDHVTVEELRGFIAGDLHGAFNEAHAISKGTQCRQFLFSVSLNPPKDAVASVDDLIEAAERAEATLGLTGQPRAIVIHEKCGRRHAHVVWSRIDAMKMKAINMPHFKTKLSGLSRDLYLHHGWELPEGHRTNGWKNPLNFTLAEWQQAQRVGLDPREVKQVFRSAWDRSDNLRTFQHALEEHGYFLAKGDRRGIVAVDIHGEVFAVARWTGLKTKELRERFGENPSLPSVEEKRRDIRKRMSDRLRGFIQEDRQKQRDELRPLHEQRDDMVAAHRAERDRMRHLQELRWGIEAKERASRLHKGLRGVWELLTGEAVQIRKRNDTESYAAYLRDRKQREMLFEEQMADRKALQTRMDILTARHRAGRLALASRVATVLRHTDRDQSERDVHRAARSRDLDYGR